VVSIAGGALRYMERDGSVIEAAVEVADRHVDRWRESIGAGVQTVRCAEEAATAT
jgi:hypothetical protein